MAHAALAPARSRDELAAYLTLAQVPGIGSARLRTLLSAFETALGALQAPHGALAALPGISLAGATAIRRAPRATGERILDTLERLGAQAILPHDAAFPPLLAEITDPPAVLYAWGDASLLERPGAAVVGSRDHTGYGAEATRMIVTGLAQAGVVVVSGMARGLDAIAHQTVLEAGGASVGVLGNGFGVVYPAANRALYERMREQGCLVTELPPGERPHAGTFPRRNRLISGLVMVTVVVEAAAKSGGLTTADAALEQGRNVLAVPGPITSRTSVGCNRLIQQGAKPALSAADVLEELGLELPAPDTKPGGPAPGPPPDLGPLERRLWDELAAEPRHVDQLAAVADAEAATVLTALTELELKGLVRQHVGMVFGRT